MRILIMRHAEAEAGQRLDPTRGLTDTGNKQAKMMAKWLKRQVDKPDLVIESNMKRSQETAAYLVDKLDAELVRSPAIDPDGTPDAALAAIQKLAKKAKAKTVIAVSHGPLVEQILAAATKGQASAFSFAHAAVAHIKDGIFHWLVTPNVVARDQDELDKVTSDAQAAIEEAARAVEAAAHRPGIRRPDKLIKKAAVKFAGALRSQQRHFIKNGLPLLKQAASLTEAAHVPDSQAIENALRAMKPISLVLGNFSIAPAISQAAEDGAAQVFEQFSRTPKIPASVKSYLEQRSLEKIGADVDETTVDQIRTILAGGLAAGESFTGIVKAVRDAGAFSRDRAQTIAVTEVGDAFSQGTLGAAKDLDAEGLDMEKSWLAEDDPCEDCQGNAQADWIDVDDDFPSGDDAPTAHPNCRCALLVRSGAQAG